MTEFDEGRFEQHLTEESGPGDRRLLVLDPQAAGALLCRRLRVGHRGGGEGATAALDLAVMLRVGGISFLRRAGASRALRYGGAARAAAAPGGIGRATIEQLQVWAENCPENFENRAALVGAEIARIEGRELDAERLYEQAIRSARANGFVHNEALANELAARFYAARGFEKIAHVYLQDARYGYLRWGADGKVRQLEQLHPHLRDAAGPAPAHHHHWRARRAARCRDRDQGLAGGVRRDRPRQAHRDADADRDRACRRRARPAHSVPRATSRGSRRKRRPAAARLRSRCVDAAASPAELPESVLHYVIRTRESVILDDASAQNPFSADDVHLPEAAPGRSSACRW